MPDKPKPEVFLSHASPDKEAAFALVEHLEANGVPCWIAPRDVPGGEQYAAAIMKGIEESRMMILLFTKHAGESNHVQRELERAVALKRPLLPVRREAITPSGAIGYFLAGVQWIDCPDSERKKMFPVIEKETKSILATLAESGSTDSPAEPDEVDDVTGSSAEPRSESPTGRFSIGKISAIAALVLAAVVAGLLLFKNGNADAPALPAENGMQLLEEGRIFAAQDAFETVLKAKPESKQARAGLAKIESRLERLGPKITSELSRIGDDFTLTLRLEGGGSTVPVGEVIPLMIESEVDCHAFVFSRISDGSDLLLFPNRENPDNLVRAGVPRRIPGSPLTLRAAPPLGEDLIYAIAATDPAVVEKFRASLGLEEKLETDPYAIFDREKPRGMVIDREEGPGKSDRPESKTSRRVIPVEIVE